LWRLTQLAVAATLPRLRVLARRALARRLHVHVAVGERAARLIESIVGLPSGSVGSVPNGVPSRQPDPVPVLRRHRSSGPWVA